MSPEAPHYAFPIPPMTRTAASNCSSSVSTHPNAWQQTFPSGSLGRGRSLLGQIHQLGLVDIGADAEMDIIQAGTPLAEFHRLSMAAIGPAAVEAGALTREQADAMIDRPAQPDFLASGFVHIGVWGQRAL
jgi:hypothetical protein